MAFNELNTKLLWYNLTYTEPPSQKKPKQQQQQQQQQQNKKTKNKKPIQNRFANYCRKQFWSKHP